MIVLGIILLVIGYFTGISILYTIGGILVVVDPRRGRPPGGWSKSLVLAHFPQALAEMRREGRAGVSPKLLSSHGF